MAEEIILDIEQKINKILNNAQMKILHEVLVNLKGECYEFRNS